MSQKGTSGTINIVKIIYYLHYSGQNRLEEGYENELKLKNFKFISVLVAVQFLVQSGIVGNL